MSAVLLLALLCAPGVAHAADEADDTDMSAEDRDALARSEFTRLRDELDKLAKRNAWSGVERTFQEMLATGITPSFDDFKIAAHAAQAVGDIGTAHDRLRRAHSIKESKDVLDWMWAIRENYGSVALKGDVGKVELAPAAMPFDPTQARAVEFAVARVAETGAFEGLLPKGDYTFGKVEIEVASFVDKRVVDTQTEAGARRARRMRNKD